MGITCGSSGSVSGKVSGKNSEVAFLVKQCLN